MLSHFCIAHLKCNAGRFSHHMTQLFWMAPLQTIEELQIQEDLHRCKFAGLCTLARSGLLKHMSQMSLSVSISMVFVMCRN